MIYKRTLNLILIAILGVCFGLPCFGMGGQGQSSAAGKGVNPNMNLTGLPIVKQKETYAMAIQRHPLTLNNLPEKEAVKRSERDTNLQINWIEIPSPAWNERINIMFASGDLPDALCKPLEASFLQNLQQLVDLTDYIEPYSPKLSGFFKERPDVKSAVTLANGRIYSFPGGVEARWNIVDDSLFINKPWLDALKLSIPTTTNEFYSVLKAFKENDLNGNGNKNDEIPFSFCQAQITQSLKSMFGSFGVLDNLEHLQVINNVVTFTPARPEFLEALRYFNRLYSEGLVDEEAFSHSQQQYIAKGRGNPVIYGSVMANLVGDLVGESRLKDFVPVAPLKGPNGVQLWNRVRTGLGLNGFLITKNCKYPEVLVRWYDYIHSSFELMMLWQLGPLNMAWGYDSAGRWRNIMDNVPQGSAFQEYWMTVAVGPNGPQCMQIYDFNNVNTRSLEGDDNTLNKLASLSLSEPFINPFPIPPGLEDTKIIQDRAILFADIDTYVKNFIASSIINGITDAQWNEHLRNCERLNVTRYAQSYQSLYDRSR